MFRLLSLSTLALAVCVAAPAQNKKGSSAIAKVGLEDTFTAKDPKAMARLGVVDYAPLVWADNKRTTDVEKVLGTMNASQEQPKVAVQFKKGDRVKIKTGAFENTDAVVEEVHSDKGMLDVSVNFFGRPTPMSLGYWEVELI